MKFSEYPYKRPDKNACIDKLNQVFEKAKSATSAQDQIDAAKEYMDISLNIDTMGTLAYIRHTLNSADEFYKAENEFYDEFGPLVAEKAQKLFQIFVDSEYRSELEKVWGKKAFEEMDMQIKSISEDILDLMGEEAKLQTQYAVLNASAKIDFKGEVLNIAQLGKYKVDQDPKIRREAFEAEAGYYKKNIEEYDDIFQKLVANRTEQAKKLGFNSYTELAYLRRGRNGYGPKEVKIFRDSVVKDLVPVVNKIKENQAKRIGTDKITYVDDTYLFADGNPAPIGTYEELIAKTKQMYTEMSPETAEFIDFLIEHELFDLLAKENKRLGGYNTNLPDFEATFIFSNFNGTSGDVDVLTHEAGHAFNSYMNRKVRDFGKTNYTMEIAETHSMTMEFFADPWFELFFEDETEKYRLLQLEQSFNFIPYGCIVDEFQHFVYDNPESTIDEKNKKWLELEKKFRPYLDFDNLPHFGEGRGWQRQQHIYTSPFYYIDYCLAQTMALRFFMMMSENREQAWEKYMYFVNHSGEQKFTDLIENTNMVSPFTEGSLKDLGEFVAKKANEMNKY